MRRAATRRALKTDFTYDAQGRLTSQQAADGAWLSYAYQLPTVDDGTLAPKLTVTSCVHGTTSCSAANALTWEQILFDGLGRKETEKIRIPATGGIVIREKKTTSNALGWKFTESVWGATSLKTTYSSYDRFGVQSPVLRFGNAPPLRPGRLESSA